MLSDKLYKTKYSKGMLSPYGNSPENFALYQKMLSRQHKDGKREHR